VIDVTEPGSPRLVGAAPGGTGGVALFGDYVCWSMQAGILRLAPVQCATATGVASFPEPALPPAFCAVPNPATGETALRFTLSRGSEVAAAVYDVRGRQVRRLSGGFMEAGARALRWDGCDEGGRMVAPGVHLIRAWAAGETRTARVVVAR
jgi:hypothetical protein